MIVEIETIPIPTGAEGDTYRHVDAAIAAIQASGLKFEVGALGTTFEGDPDDCWALIRRVHEACLASGPEMLLTLIKVEQFASVREQPTIAGMTAKFRS
jgi:uncharacterized protein YqgV (UPF0045/DUF77 family)